MADGSELDNNEDDFALIQPSKNQLKVVFKYHWVFKEVKRTVLLTVPTGTALFLEQLLISVSLAFCGHVKEDSAYLLEASGLGLAIIGMTGLCVGFGMTTALNTLASQAWGARNYKKIGIYLQRGILIINILVTLLIWALWFNSESLLNLLHQPPCVIEQAAQYIQTFSLALPPYLLVSLLQSYLFAQSIVYPFVLAGLVANVVNAIAHYLFLFVAKWGIRGAAGALTVSWYSYLFILLIVIKVLKLHVKTWDGWSKECLNNWGQFLRYGIPGFFMMFAEWGTYHLGFIVIGLYSVAEQSVFTVIAAWVDNIYVVPFSLSTAVSVRIGNELGANKPREAKQALFVALLLNGVWLVLISTVNFSLKSYIPLIFTSDLEIVKLCDTAMIVMGVMCICEHLQGVLAGALIGTGKQTFAPISNVLCYWVIGASLGVILIFLAKMGSSGYQLGLVTGSFGQVVVYSVVLLSLNWKKQAEKARKKAEVQILSSDIHEMQNEIHSNTEHSRTYSWPDERPLLEVNSSAKCDESEITPHADLNQCYLQEDFEQTTSGDSSSLGASVSFGGYSRPGNLQNSSRGSVECSKAEIVMLHERKEDEGPTPLLHKGDIKSCDTFAMSSLSDSFDSLWVSEDDVDTEPLVNETKLDDGVNITGPGAAPRPVDGAQVQSTAVTGTRDRSVTICTVLCRLLTVFVFFLIFIGGLVLSQVYVYHYDTCHLRNASINLTVNNYSESVSYSRIVDVSKNFSSDS